MGATVLAANRAAGTIRVLFQFTDWRTQSLANVFVRWVPSRAELQAMERAVTIIRPGIVVQWPPDIAKFSFPQVMPARRRIIGCVHRSSDHVTLGFEAAVSVMVGLVVAPVLIVQIADNPRATWLPLPLSCVEWHCRVSDFVAIALHISRLYRGIVITAPDAVRQEIEGQYGQVPAPPLRRLIQ